MNDMKPRRRSLVRAKAMVRRWLLLLWRSRASGWASSPMIGRGTSTHRPQLSHVGWWDGPAVLLRPRN